MRPQRSAAMKRRSNSASAKSSGRCPLYLPINDPPGPKSLRGYVERNSIAQLSNHRKEPLESLLRLASPRL